MKLDFEEKQLLAQISDPPVRTNILARLEAMKDDEPSLLQIRAGLVDKINRASDQEIFVACLAAVAEKIDVEDAPEPAATATATEDLLAAVAGGDPAKYREDLAMYGYDGFLKNLNSLDYPEEEKERIRAALGSLQ